MKLTTQQAAILREAKNLGGTITKKHAIEKFCDPVYMSPDSIAQTLSRMVNNGLLNREKPGVYTVGKGKKTKPAVIDDGQTNLF